MEETNALTEHLRKAGQAKSEKKRLAAQENLRKAREGKKVKAEQAKEKGE
jgi:hypothetical protein